MQLELAELEGADGLHDDPVKRAESLAELRVVRASFMRTRDLVWPSRRLRRLEGAEALGKLEEGGDTDCWLLLRILGLRVMGKQPLEPVGSRFSIFRIVWITQIRGAHRKVSDSWLAV